MEIKINKNNVLIMLLMLISVFPAYFHIANHMFTSMVLVPLLFTLCIISSVKINIKKFRSMSLFFACSVIMALLYCYHGDIFKGVIYIMLVFSIAIVVFNYVTSEKRMLSIIDTMIYISAFVCVLGVIEGVTGLNIFLLLDDSGSVTRNLARLGIIRIIGFTAQATHYALYISMIAFLSIYRLSNETSNKKIRRFWIILSLQVINVIFTLTRSTIVCFIVCILIILLKLGLRKFFRIVIPIIIVGMILTVFFESSFLSQFIYMMLALVSPDYANKLATGALSEYANGVADRLNLYAWVYESVKDNIIFGMGEKIQFAYTHRIDMSTFSYYETKTSIEVYSLSLLYHFGVVGMITEMWMYVNYTIKSMVLSFKKKMEFERKITFDYIMFVIFALNIINWFAVDQGEESTTLYIIMMIWVCYNSLKKEF